MTHREALLRVIEGVRSDLDDYPRLRDLLEAQFQATLKQRAQEIQQIAERISELTSLLESRRRERHALASLLAAGRSSVVTMESISARLPRTVREKFDTAWTRLEMLVRDCKEANVRNCRLVMGQYEVMQRVLHADRDTYAPG